jgi:hypothetical protein
LILNVGGGPTDDKPEVTLEPPGDPSRTSTFLILRVADIQEVYEEWSVRGAEFLTPPVDRGAEIRCYIRDPDGHLIEGEQATGFLEGLEEGGVEAGFGEAVRAERPPGQSEKIAKP